MDDFNFYDSQVSIQSELQPLESNRLLSKDISRESSVPFRMIDSSKQKGIKTVSWNSGAVGITDDFVKLDDNTAQVVFCWYLGTIRSDGVIVDQKFAQLPDFNESSPYLMGAGGKASFYTTKYNDGREEGANLVITINITGTVIPSADYTSYFQYAVLSDEFDISKYGLGRPVQITPGIF